MNIVSRFLPMLLTSIVVVCMSSKCGSGAPKSAAACAGAGKGNALTIRLEAPPKQINPLLSANAYSIRIAERVFQNLSETDPQTLTPQPVLITAIPTLRMAADGPHKGAPAYDFAIHPAATWDNGSPVTANDVAFTLKIIANPLVTTPFRGYFDLVKALEIDPADPRKFTIYLNKYYILALESLCQTPIYPAYHYDPNGYLASIPLTDLLDTKKAAVLAKVADGPLKKFADEFQSAKYAAEPANIVGSGPYRIEQFDGDQGATLVRKTNWWGDKVADANPILRALPEKLIYRVVKEDLAVENMLRTGDLDVAATLAASKFLAMQKDSSVAGCLDFNTRTGLQYSSWGFNMQHPRLRDPAVRQALSYLVDYEYIINTVYQGLAVRGLGPVSPKAPYFAKNLPMPTYDPQKAADLLKKAGWSDTNGDGTVDKVLGGKKEEMVIKVLCAASPTTQQILDGLADAVAKGGVKIQSEPLEMSLINARMQKGDYESVIWARAQGLGLTDLYQLFHSKNLAPSGDNRYRIANPELDKLIDAIRSTPDEATRNVLYIKAQQLLFELTPEITLCVPQVRVVVSKRFDYVVTDSRPGYYAPFFKVRTGQ